MAIRIFISYRRSESLSQAQHLNTLLSQVFKQENVFLDLESLRIGERWSQTIKDQVSKCDVLVAMIGEQWSTVKSENGGRRIDEPNDLVRREIAEALNQDKIVIAVLLDGAKLPRLETLPAELHQLASRNTAELSAAKFPQDVEQLSREIRVLVSKQSRRGYSLLHMAAAGIAGIAATAGAALSLTPMLGLCTTGATEQMIKNITNELHTNKKTLKNAEDRIAARLPQFKEIDANGPWSIAWKWDSPKCEGAYNLVINQKLNTIQVHGKEAQMRGRGQVLPNGRFFVQFTIDTGRYELRAEGSLLNGKGEAELVAIGAAESAPYCSGVMMVSRGKMPEARTGGGNGGGGN